MKQQFIIQRSRHYGYLEKFSLLLINKGLIEESKLVRKRMFIDLYDNWGVLYLNNEMQELLKERWNKIHLNHSDNTLFCSDLKCPKHKMIIHDESDYF